MREEERAKRYLRKRSRERSRDHGKHLRQRSQTQGNFREAELVEKRLRDWEQRCEVRNIMVHVNTAKETLRWGPRYKRDWAFRINTYINADHLVWFAMPVVSLVA